MASVIPTLDEMLRGNYRIISFTIDEPDPATPGERRVRDITNDTFRCTFKTSWRSTTALISKTSDVDGGITITDGINGEGEIELLSTDTSALNLTYDPTILEGDIEGTPPGDPAKPYTIRFKLPIRADIST